MSICSIEHIEKINSSIGRYFSVQGKSNFSFEGMEKYIAEKSGITDFKLENYIVNPEIKNKIEGLFNKYSVGKVGDYIKLPTNSSYLRSNIVSSFTSDAVLDLFDSLPIAKLEFERQIEGALIKEIVIGEGTSDKYVSTNAELTKNITRFKADTFKSIQKFLVSNKKLRENEVQELFNKTGDILSYEHYKKVLGLLSDYFIKGTFDTITSYTGKTIPNLDLDLAENKEIYKAYNDGVLLTNFDSILRIYFKDIVKTDIRFFDSLQSNLGKQDKYNLKIEGLKTEYFKNDTHASESSESSESSLTKMLIAAIPAYNKKNERDSGYLHINDFYLFAAQLSNFELLFGNKLRNENTTGFEYFNKDSKTALNWYLENIIKSYKNKGSGIITELGNHFKTNINFVYSLHNFLNSEEFNIKKKEENSKESLVSILTQVINNNFGASYFKYTSKGAFIVQEMYKQDFNNIQLNNTTFSKVKSKFNKQDQYNINKDKSVAQVGFNKLFENISETTQDVNGKEIPALITEISLDKKVEISKYITEKTGIVTHYISFQSVINDLKKNLTGNKPITVNFFKNKLKTLVGSLYLDMNSEIFKTAMQDGSIDKDTIGDVTVADYIKNTVQDPLYKAIQAAYLENFVLKPVMNVSTLSGEMLPSFKMANLTYKDTELFDLQRDFESKNKNSFYKSSLIRDAVILGTGTKLEAINKDVNKNAAKFTVSENYISDFQFEFLKSLVKNESFSVILGNYSDKNTVLKKIINAKHVFNVEGTDKTSLIQRSVADIQEATRSQGFMFYKDTIKKVFEDYKHLFSFLNIENKINLDSFSEADFENSVVEINRILSKNNIRDLIQQYMFKNPKDISKLNIVEELHFSKYKNGIFLNETLVNNYRIFSNKTNFKQFIKVQENLFIEDFKNYNKNLKGGGESLNLLDGVKKDKDKYLTALSLKDSDFGSDKDFDKLLVKGGKELNPLLAKWMWANAFYRNEYLFISAKGEHMHPHKIRGFEHKGKLDWDSYQLEVSGRLSSMAKRNVLFTATIETPVRNSPLGVPDRVNHATIDDFKTDVFNYTGNSKLGEKGQDAHDGGSFIDYVYSKMLDASYPGKGYSGTKKQFATFVTPIGVSIKKDAESIITNAKLWNSKNSTIKLLDKKKQMLGLEIGELYMDAKYDLTGEDFHFIRNGELYKIKSLKINNKNYEMSVSKKTPEGWVNVKEITGTFNTLYDLWEGFGGMYSTDANGNFSEGSNDLLYKIVTTKDSDNKYPLKDKIIHVISNLSAMKAGAVNVNKSNMWNMPDDLKKINPQLAYTTFESRFMGPQLDASHESDQSEIKEVTQVISALAQGGDTSELAKEAYQDIANIIKRSIDKFSKYLEPKKTGSGEFKIDTEELYKYVSNKFIDTIKHSKGENIAKVLIDSFKSDVKIPFSNQNFFTPFVRDIITRMNNDFITRHYSGMGVVLLPSHGMIQLYDVPQEDGIIKVVSQKELAQEAFKEAINSGNPTNNDEILNRHLNKKLAPTSIGQDQIKMFDTVSLLFEKEVSNLARQILKNSPESKETLLSYYLDEGMNSEEALKSAEHTVDRFLIWNYGEEVPEEVDLSNFNVFLAEDAIYREDFLNYDEKIITLNNPQKYYEVKELAKNASKISKINTVPRDLKPAETNFVEEKVINNQIYRIDKSIWDFDSTRMRYDLQIKSEITDEIKQFAQYWNQDLSTENGIYNTIVYLNKWSQRNLSLMNDRKTMINISDVTDENGIIDFSKIFNGDNLLKIYPDAKQHYTVGENLNEVVDYKFDPAEIIVGNIYKTNFDLNNNDSIYEIEKLGAEYFKNKLREQFENDDTQADLKLITDKNKNIYIKYVDDLPGFRKDVNLVELPFQNEEGLTITKFVKIDELGNEVYTLPDSDNYRVTFDNNGNEIILVKKLIKIPGKKPHWERNNVNVGELINSMRGSVKAVVPLMNIEFNNSIPTLNKDGKLIDMSLSQDTLFLFSDFYNYKRKGEEILGTNWLENNKEDIINSLSTKKFVNWQKSRESIVARIPSQSKQSFMPMKNVAYFEGDSNDAFVSIWQIFIQGSDF